VSGAADRLHLRDDPRRQVANRPVYVTMASPSTATATCSPVRRTGGGEGDKGLPVAVTATWPQVATRERAWPELAPFLNFRHEIRA
jgi:hypothetical protein